MSSVAASMPSASATATAPFALEEPLPLAGMLAPRCVAVIGADLGAQSNGHTVLANIMASPFKGMICPVSTTQTSLLGVRTVANLAAISERIDLAVIAVPPEQLPDVIAACVAAGVVGAVILTFDTAKDRADASLTERVCAIARAGKLRLIGMESLGFMNPLTGFNGTGISSLVKSGGIAFISQSTAMCTTIVDWSRREGVGFSGIVSLGTMIDIGWGDLIDHFGSDPNTNAILLSLEDMGDTRAFLSAARAVAVTKPIIAIRNKRIGPTSPALRSGLSFDPDEVIDALLARAGVLRVETIADLFGAADLIGNQPRPAGGRLAIVTNAGSPSLLAADVVTRGGNEIATLTSETITALDSELAASTGTGFPIGVLVDPPPESFAAAMRLALADSGCDGVLLVLAPHGRAEPARTAELVIEQARDAGKPVFASWMGGPAVEQGRALLRRSGVPHFDFPDAAARAWNTLCSYNQRIRLLYETPRLAPNDGQDAPDRTTAHAIISAVLVDGRTSLHAEEARRLLAAYHLSPQGQIVAVTDDEAIQAAERIGYPVRLIPYHPGTSIQRGGTDSHAHLGVDSSNSLRMAFHAIRNAVQTSRGSQEFDGVVVQSMPYQHAADLCIAMNVDPQIGPVIGVGLGGTLGTVYDDRAYGLPPLTYVLAQRLLERVRFTQVDQADDPENQDVLAWALVRLSHLVVEQPRIRSVIIDSVAARGGGLSVSGMHIELHSTAVSDQQLPRPLVRPYPVEYCSDVALRDGTAVRLRPVQPEDEPAFVMLHQQLSVETVRLHYATDYPLDQRITHARLARMCQADFHRDIALVAELGIPGVGNDLIGFGRVSRTLGKDDMAAVSLLVVDQWQNHGLGAHLLSALIAIAHQEGIHHLKADFVPENHLLHKLLSDHGFVIGTRNDALLHADLSL